MTEGESYDCKKRQSVRQRHGEGRRGGVGVGVERGWGRGHQGMCQRSDICSEGED